MRNWYLGMYLLILAAAVLTALMTGKIYHRTLQVISLGGGSIACLGVFKREGFFVSVGVITMGVPFYLINLFSPMQLFTVVILGGMFFLLYLIKLLSSRLFVVEDILDRSEGYQGLHLRGYLMDANQRLSSTVLYAFLITMMGTLIAWNSVLELSMDEDIFVIFIPFALLTIFLLYLLMEYIPRTGYFEEQG